VNELASLSNVLFPRQSEIRRLEGLILEASHKLQALALLGQDDERQRDSFSELKKKLARMKGISQTKSGGLER
jgi:hypothetical protein